MTGQQPSLQKLEYQLRDDGQQCRRYGALQDQPHIVQRQAGDDGITQATGGEVVPSAGGTGGGTTPTEPGQPTQPGGGGDQPGGTGCQSHEDCGGGLCVSDGSQSICTTTCSSAEDGPLGMDCFATDEDPNVGVCWPADEPGTVDPDDDQTGVDKGIGGGGGGGGRYEDEDEGMGCSVATDRSAPASLLALVALGLVAFRRRRR